MPEFEGEVKPSSIDKNEHVDVNGVGLKRVLMAGFDGTNVWDATVTEDGSVQVSDPLTGAIQELISRLDTLAACKHHLAEALRVQVIGGSLATSGSTSLDATQTNYYTPTYARFLNHMAVGNPAAVLSNIQNVVV